MNSTIQHLVEASKIASSIVLLGIMTVQDLRTREISSSLVYAHLGLSIVFFTASSLFTRLPVFLRLFYALVSVTATAGVFYLLYRPGLIGKGDLFVSLAIGLSYAYPDVYGLLPAGYGILPPSLVIVLYSAFTSALTMVYNLTASLRRREELKKLTGLYKFVVPLIARPVKLRDLINGRCKHVYPVQHFTVEGDKITVKFKLVINVEKDESLKDVLGELLAKGYLNENTHIWVTPGLPYILFFLAGLVLFLFTGDKPVVSILVFLFNLLN